MTTITAPLQNAPVQNASLQDAPASASSIPASRAPGSPASPSAAAPGKGALWTGRVLSGLAVLFLAFDAGIKLVMAPEAVAGTSELGWPVDVIRGLGVLEILCLVIYLVPRTAVVGAVLWTGYFGGAIATHLRVHNPLFSHTLFPIYIALLIWGGLWLRDRRVRAMIAR
jgi:hypothetical protein